MSLDNKGLLGYWRVFMRRKKAVLLTAAVVLAAGAVVTFLLPPSYRSSAVVLIEQQDIPADLVRSTITSYADQRIQVLRQRVMTSTNLLGIMKKYDLYRDRRQTETREELLLRMRDDITMKPIVAEVIDPRSGRPTQATIALNLAFTYREAGTAQKVANELVSLFLNENIETRTKQAEETSVFLRQEGRRLSERIAVLEKKLAQFKESHMGALPEQVQLNMQLLNRTELELLETDRRIRSLQERKIYLESELAQISPSAAVYTGTGERILTAQGRLKALEAGYISAIARYSPSHPDVIKMRKELEALRAEVGWDPQSIDGLRKQLVGLQAEQAQLREKYSGDHPDVRKLNQTIIALVEQIRNARQQHKETQATAKADNPAYIKLKAELSATREELSSLYRSRAEGREKLTQYQEHLAAAPQVEREYLTLTRDYDNATAKYREIRAKQMEAQLAEQLEKGRKGERMSLIEPPLRPEKPASPNRPLLLALSVLLALAAGLGVMLLIEALDGSVRGVAELTRLVGRHPLAVVPSIHHSLDTRWQRRRRKMAVGVSSAAVLAIALLALHLFVTPLDGVWHATQRTLETLRG